jgi:hypothetical protein
MKKLLFLLVFVNLFAFSPNHIDTKILITDLHHAIVDNKNIQNGLTGYVIHNNMIIAKALSLGKSRVEYLPFGALKNNALAKPKIMPKKGDKIIFGLYNKRGLIIAPNQNEYIQAQNNYPNIKWINSDLFATYFESKPTKEDFRNFCSDVKVGIIDFILDKEYIVDCQSMTILQTTKIKSSTYTKPFFCSYDKFKGGIFSSIPNNWIRYYKSLIRGNNGK